MAQITTSFILSSPDKTAAFARRISSFLKKGDVILLEGQIGAGKSFFARSLILSLLTSPEDVPSPTFTLVQTYETPSFDIWHCDLYRLTDPNEAIELGLEDAFYSALCLIEWPDRLAEITPTNALTVSFSTTPNPEERKLTVSFTSDRWASLQEHLHEH